MKPLGTNNAAENGLTTSKSAFGKPNSPSRFATKNRFSIARSITTKERSNRLGNSNALI
ncbi:hypothetical protein RGL54_004930 [Vibrio parahaemolyticus]|nr:hypothetical protein [Vibrio parahaemolyticus]